MVTILYAKHSYLKKHQCFVFHHLLLYFYFKKITIFSSLDAG